MLKNELKLESDDASWESDVQEYKMISKSSPLRLTPLNRKTTISSWEDDMQEYDGPIAPLPSLPNESSILRRESDEECSLFNLEKESSIGKQQTSPFLEKPRYRASRKISPMISCRGVIVEELSDAELSLEVKEDIKAQSSDVKTQTEGYRRQNLAPLVYPVSLQLQQSNTTTSELDEHSIIGTNSSVGSLVENFSINDDIKQHNDFGLKHLGVRTHRSWSLFEGTTEYLEPKKRWGSFSRRHNAKSKVKGKKQKNFEFLRMEQIIMQHQGAVWAMKFSVDGRYLATGGDDAIVRLWTVVGHYVQQEKRKSMPNTTSQTTANRRENNLKPPEGSIINPIPYRELRGHQAEITDIDWSVKNYILSSSRDATVMLWHHKGRCIRLFRHADYVSCARFHPTNTNYYVSASYDTKIRLWHIGDHKVVAWQKLDTLATAVAFSPNGKFLVAGLYDGLCIFFIVELERGRLRWHQKVECRNKKQSGKRVTSVLYFSFDRNEIGKDKDQKHHQGSNQCLVTTNDSRIRLYTLENYHIDLKTKYKGHKNAKHQIGASFSQDGKFVISGSDDGAIYIWNKETEAQKRTGHSKMKKYEVITAPSRKGATNVVIFAPRHTVGYLEKHRQLAKGSNHFVGMPKISHIILSADKQGIIRIFVNYRSRPSAFRQTK